MYINTVATGIELIGYAITDIKIENTIVDLYSDAEKKFGLNVFEPTVSEKGITSQINIQIVVEIEQDGKKYSNIDMIMNGSFRAIRKMPREELIRLVSINGVASMIGIARGKIESISASLYNTGKIVIPFVNVVEYYKEIESQIKKKTTNL